LKIEINYSTYPYAAKKYLKWAVIAAFILSVLLLLYMIREASAWRGETARYNAGTARIENEIKTLNLKPVSKNEMTGLEKKIKVLNDMIVRKSFSWTRFLNDLEKAIPANISVKKIEPKFLDHGVTISGEALTLKDLTRLILSLETHPQFNQVFLLDQKVGNENRVEFQVHLNYLDKGKNEQEAPPKL